MWEHHRFSFNSSIVQFDLILSDRVYFSDIIIIIKCKGEVVLAKIDFEVPYLRFSGNFEISDNGKSTVVFGSNGMGKSSIYNAIKEKHNEYNYIDYNDMKNAFISGKDKELNVTPFVQEYNDLVVEKTNNRKSLDVTDSLKRFDINSANKVKKTAPNLSEVQKTKEVLSVLTITKESHGSLSNVDDDDIKFLSENFDALNQIVDIDEDVKILKEEYMKDVLKHLDENLHEDCVICPICDSTVPDLKTIIREKHNKTKQIKLDLLKVFKANNQSAKNECIIIRFNKLLELSKSLSLKDIQDYMLVPDFSKVEEINQAIQKDIKLNVQVEKAKIKMIDSYTNLKNIQKEYTSYISAKFVVEALFSDEDHSIKIKLKRYPKEYSTGEFNLILFATKIFEYVGSDKKLVILDDPISSYDIINQYKIAFDIVSNNKNGEKNFLIFTHNMSLINLINSQQRGLFDFRMIDKIEGTLYIYNLNDFNSSSITSIQSFIEKSQDNRRLKFVKLAMERDNEKVDLGTQEMIHPLFHYDSFYEFNLSNHPLYESGLTNDYLQDVIDELKYDNFDKTSYAELVIYKVVLMLGLRVWVEKKLLDALKSDQSYLNIESFAEKISYALPRNAKSRVSKEYPNLERIDLMGRKVMLNQHGHYMSQGEPFHYVLNLSVDDIYIEIKEITSLFR